MHLGRDSGVRVPLQALEVGFQFGAGLAADLAIFFQGFVDDFFQPWQELPDSSARGDRRPIQNRLEDHSRGIAPKRQRARAHLIKHCAEGKQIGAHRVLFPATCSGLM